jgi:superfamily II DNA or RNA helicase
MQLRAYQQQAIDDLRAAMQCGARSPLLCLPTGGGKTIIFSAIASSAAARGRQVLILVHRRELLQQASRKLTDIGLDQSPTSSGGFSPNPGAAPGSDRLVAITDHHRRSPSRLGWILDNNLGQVA